MMNVNVLALRRPARRAGPFLACVLALSGLAAPLASQQPVNPTGLGSGGPGDQPTGRFRFAVIGDWGWSNPLLQEVADAVKASEPDFIITTGDNNYPFGARNTIDDNIGQYYSDFIFPYTGKYGSGATTNRFFPSLGNHDLYDENGEAYLSKPKGAPHTRYFELPGNERYYDFVWGQVHFFALSSDPSEPDGISYLSPQAQWLQQRLINSPAALKVVYFHHAPYSSSVHGGAEWMRWPFAEWGVDVVLAGHDHVYERHRAGGLPFIVNGVGGTYNYPFLATQPTSEFRFNLALGYQLAEVRDDRMVLSFISNGIVLDTFTVTPFFPTTQAQSLIVSHADWRYLDDGSDQGEAWRKNDFEDRGWNQGSAILGYGNGDEATTVAFGEDVLQKHATTYFRKSFEVVDPELFKHLDLNLVRDDGVVVYLNGAEVYRSNMPQGDVAFDTLAGVPVEDPSFPSVCITHIDPGRLIQGQNVLAVEVHQVLPSSGDLSFDLELIGRF